MDVRGRFARFPFGNQFGAHRPPLEHRTRRPIYPSYPRCFCGSGERQLLGPTINEVRPSYFKLAVQSHFLYRRSDDAVIHVVRIQHQRMDVLAHLND